MSEPIDQAEKQTDTTKPASIPERFLQIPWGGITLICLGLMLLSLGFFAIHQLFYGYESELFMVAGGLFGLPILPCLILTLLAMVFGRSSDSPLQKRMLIVGILLSIVGCSLFMVGSFLDGFEYAQQAAVQQHLKEEQRWVQTPFGDGTFQISVPSTWVTNTAAEQIPGMLALTEPQHGLCLQAMAFPKSDLAVESLSELHELEVAEQASLLEDPSVTTFDKTRFGAATVAASHMTGVVDGINLEFHISNLDYGGYWVSVWIWAAPSRFEEHAELWEQILGSVEPVH